jgi:DNA-binding XRE family transcriptional regulator
MMTFSRCIAKWTCNANLLVVFCSYNSKSRSVANQDKFFSALGTRVRELRKKRGYSQEDMIFYGFSTRHWQQVEAGRPITVTTLLRICEVFKTPMSKLVEGLDKQGVYEALDIEIPLRGNRVRKKR